MSGLSKVACIVTLIWLDRLCGAGFLHKVTPWVVVVVVLTCLWLKRQKLSDCFADVSLKNVISRKNFNEKC